MSRGSVVVFGRSRPAGVWGRIVRMQSKADVDVFLAADPVILSGSAFPTNGWRSCQFRRLRSGGDGLPPGAPRLSEEP